MKGKVEADLASEEKLMDEYTKWCDEEANAKEDALTSNKRSVGDLAATIEDASASLGELTTEVADPGSEERSQRVPVLHLAAVEYAQGI